jgi:conjugal transfer pilus assembly protein TrbC
MKKIPCFVILCLLYLGFSAQLHAQRNPLFDAIESHARVFEQSNKRAQGYIFVSQSMSQQDLIELSAQAKQADMTMVIRGFAEQGPKSLEQTRSKVALINAACCHHQGPTWLIHPELFERYAVSGVPSFVVAQIPGSNAQAQNARDRVKEFTKVSGEMSVQNALKFIYAGTENPLVKQHVASVYRNFEERAQ